MLTDPRQILLDVASRSVFFQTRSVYVLKTIELWLDKAFSAAEAATTTYCC